MTTATLPAEQAPAKTDAPTDSAALAALFYGSAKETDAASPVTTDPPAQTPATDTSLTSEKTPATPPVDAKAAESQKGPETTETPETKEQKDAKADKEESHRAAAARLGRQVQELQAKFDTLAEEKRILEAKANGTYQEPAQPTPEEIARRADFEGREKASRFVAERDLGADVVKAKIYDPDSPFQKLSKAKPEIQIEVLRDPFPTMAALRIVERESFYEKYGADPAQWESKIIESAKPRLFEEYKKQFDKTPTGTPVPTVTDTRASAGRTPRTPTLAETFYGKSH